jgi:hypothetical protein
MSSHVTGFVVLYRNQPVAALPFGLPAPFSVALVAVTAVAGFVVTRGLDAAVVNDKTEPNEVPTLLVAIAQK